MNKSNTLFVPAESVILSLQEELYQQNVYLFKDIKRASDNIMVTCPFHKGGMERTPSFGINVHNGLCHCFTCGWKGTIESLATELLKYDGNKWIQQNFITVAKGSRKPIELNLQRRQDEQEQRISEEELDRYRYIHPYMYKRGLTDQLIEQFDVGFDKDFVIGGRSTQCITFPVYDTQGEPLFIARRSIHGKFFRYPSRTSKPVYAANFITSREVVVCESILNALTCWKHGLQAVALLGTGTEEQYEILKELPVRKYILGFDPDEAGMKATERFKYKMNKSKLITTLEIPYGKDINDLDSDVLKLREFY